MKGRRDSGGSRMSETKEVTTVVKAAAMLGGVSVRKRCSFVLS
jgi:hypothetical protein